MSSGKVRVTGFTIDSGSGKYLVTSIVHFRTTTGFGKLVTTRTFKKEVFKGVNVRHCYLLLAVNATSPPTSAITQVVRTSRAITLAVLL